MKTHNKMLPDTWVHVFREARPTRGEDNYCRCIGADTALYAVFDGCGGSGARTHEFYSEMTEAYMASRLCAGVFRDSFFELFSNPNGLSAADFTKKAAENCKLVLDVFQPPKDLSMSAFGGSLMKVLPTTVAAVLLRPEADAVSVTGIWAGDSRAYLLEESGLAQLTVDDNRVSDPFENLYEDGVMNNIICAGKDISLHTNTVSAKRPFVVIAATDGCFGYYTTPMEFEAVLLETLQEADSIAQWENLLADRIGLVAGDDYTLQLAAYGYTSFEQLKKAYEKRLTELQEKYLKPLQTLEKDDRETRRTLWMQYRPDYMKYIREAEQ